MDWTEPNLAKLPVKELKLLARKSNVNPNFKKAELVKALLCSISDTANQSENSEAQTSRRMTRSRVSIWQASNDTLDTMKDSRAKLKDLEGNLNLDLKGSVDKRSKKKRSVESPGACDTSEMFPLVSTIQLASKPLLEITNKDNNLVGKNKQNECGTAVKSKRRKQNKVEKKNIEDNLPTNNSTGDGAASTLYPCLTDESSEKTDSVLNSTFVVEEIDENQHPSTEVENESGKSKRGKKHKLVSSLEIEKPVKNTIQHESSEAFESQDKSKETLNLKRKTQKSSLPSETSELDVQSDSQISSKSNKTKRKKGGEKKTSSRNETPDNVESSTVLSPSKVIDDFCETESKKVLTRKISLSNEWKQDDSKKRKRRNSPPPEISNVSSESNFSQTDQNKSKRKKGDQSHENNVLNSPKIAVVDDKYKRGEKKNPLSSEIEPTRTQELTEVIEKTVYNTSVLRGSLRKIGSTQNFLNGFTVVNDSEKNNQTKKDNNSIRTTLDDQDISSVESQTGNKIIVPVRSSTFILPDSDIAAKMPVAVPHRGSTFIFSKFDGKIPHRRSSRFSPGSAASDKSTPLKETVTKSGKSIGNRIMQNSVLKRGDPKSSKKESGSALKKTIVKNSMSGSVIKKKHGSKLPNFKKIHLQLFNNMESIGENKKRQQDRAQVLLQSPIVPRCALLSPRLTKVANSESSSSSKMVNTEVKNPVIPLKTAVAPLTTSLAPSPLAKKLKTPVAARTPSTLQKPVSDVSSVNRFGYRKPVKKEEATSIIRKKMPLVKVEHTKEQERNLLKLVRMNKRFMLQMQMRQAEKASEK